MKRVLILGAGLVSRPAIEYFLGRGFTLVVASPMKDRADAMIKGNPDGIAIDWSMDDAGTLEKLVRESDITLSLLPYRFHPAVARLCLKHGKPLVTTSYVQPEMHALDDDAKKRGVLLLNETGLDPGIDHMSAMRIIDRVHRDGGSVDAFYSVCGALPAPEAADNPLAYKFTWSPMGVILAGFNSALYLADGKRIHVDPAGLFRKRFICNIRDVGELEVYPNRDSVKLIDIYGIPEVKTIFRGTLRFKGWCETLDAMKGLGMLDEKPRDYSGMTHAGFLAERAGCNTKNMRKSVSRQLGIDKNSIAIKSLGWLGFFSKKKLMQNVTTPLEITSDAMIRRMMLKDNERDMVIMEHLVFASYPGGRKEATRSSMLDFGTPSCNTAIARTVALPAAIAVELILGNKIGIPGVHRPVTPGIYNPVLDGLKNLGIEMKDEPGLSLPGPPLPL
jgi:saccharopine dehydrogenase-like NADP-dependent oxidoreductase